MPLHSVLIPHRNRIEHLSLCREALDAASQGRPIEIIVVDQSDTRPEDFPDVHHLPFRAPYNKSKALNIAASMATGDLVTILDVDCIVPVQFFARIEDTFAQNGRIKLGHRVKLLNQKGEIVGRAAEQYRGEIWGCGIYTVRRQDLLPYDERFKGFGLEDYEINGRYAASGLTTLIRDDNDLHHLWHTQTPDWRTPELEKANRELFIAQEKNGFPPLVC